MMHPHTHIALVISAITLFLASGCLKPPDYPDSPEIKILQVNPTQFEELADFKLKFSFTDGDGDLGDDTKSEIMIWSNANPDSVILFGIEDISSRGNTSAISGEIEVTLQSYCRCDWELDHTYGVDMDTLKFYVQIVDRAGNLSNIDSTQQVLVECFPVYEVARENFMCL
jgi:hypothetical protein